MPDQLNNLIKEILANPEARAAYEDAEARHKVMDALVGHRKAEGLTQTEVAKAMGIRQPALSGFESEASDPRMSTLMRYARAVGARLEIRVVLPDD